MKFFILIGLLTVFSNLEKTLAVPCFTSVSDTSTYSECFNENTVTKTAALMPVTSETNCSNYVCALTSPTPASCQTSGGSDIMTASTTTLGSIDVSYTGTDNIQCITTLTCTADDTTDVNNTVT